MALLNYKEESKKEYGTSSSFAVEHLNAGSLQRIADATEAMAKNHIRLQSDLDWYTRMYNQERETTKRLNNEIRSLKGWITRLKKLNNTL